MKLRIKGNSIRLRLSKTDVANLCSEGALEESISFGENTLVYALETNSAEEISAGFTDNRITVYIPEYLIEDWDTNETVGFNWGMNINDMEQLRILIEKDFQCIDETTEDQSDNFENPKAC